jgi:hypothetical protein
LCDTTLIIEAPNGSKNPAQQHNQHRQPGDGNTGNLAAQQQNSLATQQCNGAARTAEQQSNQATEQQAAGATEQRNNENVEQQEQQEQPGNRQATSNTAAIKNTETRSMQQCKDTT